MSIFEQLGLHSMLLRDELRMTRYREAIARAVKPGDIVLDAGCGSGILSFFCCQAGAAKVYAVDRGSIVSVSEQIAQQNNFSDRVQFIRDDLRNIDLPEPVDVIVSELIAKAFLGEGMIGLIGLCRDRFLKPGGRIIPLETSLLVAPVESMKQFEKLGVPEPSEYGIDFSAIAALNVQSMTSTRFDPEQLIGPAEKIFHYQAFDPSHSNLDVTVTLTCQRKATLHGFAAWFEADLYDGVELSNSPPGTGSWDNGFFPLPEAVSVEPGYQCRVRFRVPVVQDSLPMWSWTTEVLDPQGHVVATFDQSRFNAMAAEIRQLMGKTASGHQPRLTASGRVTSHVLRWSDGNTSVGHMAAQLEHQPELATVLEKDALGTVQAALRGAVVNGFVC